MSYSSIASNPRLYTAFLSFVAVQVRQADATVRARLATSKIARELFLAIQLAQFCRIVPAHV